MIGTPNLPPNYTLDDLTNLNANSGYYELHASYINIRQQALQEAAQALGMQAALNYESNAIDALLMEHSEELNRIFDFNQVMYQDNILPPVLTKADNLVNINPEGNTIRIAGTTYNIIAPVKFVTAPPTWRDYIWLAYPDPNLPDKSLLPENKQEQAFWRANVMQGWMQGINQALSIFTINLNTLSRDYNGMVLYKELLVQNRVSPYYVDHTEQGITGNGRHMVIDDRTMQITAQPQLLYKSQSWEATPVSIEAAPQAASSLEDALDKAVKFNAISK